MSDGYNDEPTAEELELLRQDNTIPPADDESQAPAPAPEAAPAPAPAPAAEPAPAPAPAAEPAPAPAQTEDERFAAFMAQHAGKSSEEIARLAFQQQQRANAEGFRARQARESVEATQTRVREALERAAQRREQIAQERQTFAQRLQDDPDAATREMHERMLSTEEQALAQEEVRARQDAAVGLARAAIPDFDRIAPEVHAFGAEMNYTPEELNGITDGRDLVTLHLASLAGKLMKAGVIDVHGRFLKMPTAHEATDPRLNPPAAVTTLSSAPARSNGGGQSLGDQLMDISKMSDADFDKLDPKVLEDLLRQAG